MSLLTELARRRRAVNVLIAIAVAAMLGYALYAQRQLGLEPCPLCIFQRVGIAALGAVALLAALHGPRSPWGRRCYALTGLIAGGATVGVAARHIYIQSLPPGSVPSCGSTLDFMLEVLPLTDVVRKVLTGGGECAQIDWRFAGLTMPQWVLLAAALLTAVFVIANWRRDTPDQASRLQSIR
ncbi:MAG: disulfide bond formation protein B [Steroidobacteraceae bacterium]